MYKDNKTLPTKDELVLIWCKDMKLPEVAIFQVFENVSEFWIPSNDEVESIDNVLRWMSIPK